ncbi:hypothetical protein OJF2_51800 [Aquisphaera giovannonii]|uniref:Uncharacterized protein n=1 Tax=Aquisphaera giovannonii TaxID=406548 RepID=A0A5B9W7D8_9BACT|nr:hypothetical protein [Aquisphaera giovannonii]QEH36596.1 hypothetical protein OJF2_51800 [Aquisphaera giovannonii]
MIPRFARLLTIGICLFAATSARADVASKIAQETAEFVLKKFGKKAITEGTESLAKRIASSAARHGDDVFKAVRRVGPGALSLADDAGEQAPKVLRLLSKHGDDAAVWVARRPKALKLLSQHGDEAAEVLIKHKGLAEPVLEKLGAPAVNALSAVAPQGGRRLAMLAESGELAAIGRTPELLEVISRHGDAAMNFIWRNKGPLAVGTTLTAFLAKPEAFIDGTNQLIGTVGENAVKPIAEAAGTAISCLVWAVVALVVGVPAAGIYLAVRNPKLAAELTKAAVSRGVNARS